MSVAVADSPNRADVESLAEMENCRSVELSKWPDLSRTPPSIVFLVPHALIRFSRFRRMKCSVIKDGVKKLALKQPIYIPSPVDPLYAQQLVFQGISVDNHGEGKQ